MHDLPFQTPTQFIALGITLLAGWLFGLATRSGGGKWRERYHDEERSSAGYRDKVKSDLRNASQRIHDLEAENARLRAEVLEVTSPTLAGRPTGHSTATVVGATVAGATAGAAVTHAADRDGKPVVADHAEPAHAPQAPSDTKR
jgi:hypothetical protein